MDESQGYSLERLVGAIDARTAMLERRVATLEVDIKTELRIMNERWSSVNTTINQARGGWRAVAWLSGIAATLGGAISYGIHLLAGTGSP
jgi:hypothetical protein